MNTVAQIWNTIITSNFFNFVVMVLILAWIFKKTDLINKLENAKLNIKNSIAHSEQEKINAEKELLNTKKSIESLEDEIQIKIQDAENKAETLAQNIKSTTESRIQKIKTSVETAIQSEEKMLSAALSKKTARASSELAKEHIKNVLKAHPELHEKYITQSIEELG